MGSGFCKLGRYGIVRNCTIAFCIKVNVWSMHLRVPALVMAWLYNCCDNDVFGKGAGFILFLLVIQSTLFLEHIKNALFYVSSLKGKMSSYRPVAKKFAFSWRIV